MTAKIGYKSTVGFVEDATFGASGSTPTSFLEFSSESFTKEIEEQNIEAINGGRQYEKRVTLAETANGGLDFPLVPGGLLKMFKHLSGDPGTTSTLAAGVYQHVFVFNELTTNTSLTWYVNRDTADTDTAYYYTNSKINSASFNITTNELLNCSLDLMCKDQVAANTISTASFRTYNPYKFTQATVKLGATAAAATSTSVESWGLTIGNNLLDDRSLGTATRDVIEPGMQDITYDITARYESPSLTNLFLNGTKTYILAEFDSGVTIASTYTHKITFESWNCYFNGTIPNIGSASEIIKQALPVRAIEEDASVGSLVVTVVSEEATV